MGKFTVEEILKEYESDAPRKEKRPASHGYRSWDTKPISHEKPLPPEDFTETAAENLMDIRATISKIKTRKESPEPDISLTERPAGQTWKNNISYMDHYQNGGEYGKIHS